MVLLFKGFEQHLYMLLGRALSLVEVFQLWALQTLEQFLGKAEDVYSLSE